jgi:hypothetical protein
MTGSITEIDRREDLIEKLNELFDHLADLVIDSQSENGAILLKTVIELYSEYHLEKTFYMECIEADKLLDFGYER